jgi:hypothetical protein
MTEHTATNNAICPYCDYEESDSWEIRLGDGYGEGDGTHDCAGCGKEYRVSRLVHVTYNTAPMDKP